MMASIGPHVVATNGGKVFTQGMVLSLIEVDGILLGAGEIWRPAVGRQGRSLDHGVLTEDRWSRQTRVSAGMSIRSAWAAGMGIATSKTPSRRLPSCVGRPTSGLSWECSTVIGFSTNGSMTCRPVATRCTAAQQRPVSLRGSG
ncbi:MAG: hypothetical protein R2787_14690 [Saprospiraceae bacterium]